MGPNNGNRDSIFKEKHFFNKLGKEALFPLLLGLGKRRHFTQYLEEDLHSFTMGL